VLTRCPLQERREAARASDRPCHGIGGDLDVAGPEQGAAWSRACDRFVRRRRPRDEASHDHRTNHPAVSYGVILANESTKRDALDVNVLVNFVMSDNRLIGSATSHAGDIAAGTQHALGGEVSFPGGAPIARLEVVVKIGHSGPATHTKPGISAVRVLPSVFEPAWSGSVEGEIQNDSASRTLQSVELSAVVLDAGGNIIGGGSGFGISSLPPSARVFFKIDNGMRPIPYSKVASALVSVVPTYQQNP
jgi:hypothetical protein